MMMREPQPMPCHSGGEIALRHVDEHTRHELPAIEAAPVGPNRGLGTGTPIDEIENRPREHPVGTLTDCRCPSFSLKNGT